MSPTDSTSDMSPVGVQRMQWNNVPDLGDVQPLSEADHPCLAELRDVLARHGMLDRFGLTLIHKHFEMSDDEVMVESNDPISRTLTIRPVKRDAIDANQVTVTNWKLTNGDDLITTVCYCPRNYLGHIGTHKWG